MSHYNDEIGLICWVYYYFNSPNRRGFFSHDSSFHPFHREVTKQALFSVKPSFQSLPRLNAPRNKPNFSCCNWVQHRMGDTMRPAAHLPKGGGILLAAMGTNHVFISQHRKRLMDCWKQTSGLNSQFHHVYTMFHAALQPLLSTGSTFHEFSKFTVLDLTKSSGEKAHCKQIILL